MKKIIALAAIMAVAPAFAAHNTFTFQVNSSGAEAYVCGFYFAGIGDMRHPVYSGSTVTWLETSVDTWTGEETDDAQSQTLNISGTETVYDLHEQKIGSLDSYKAIKNLTFNFSDEKFGNEYGVKICYNVPLFYDLSKVQFDVRMESSFKNFDLTAQRDYISKAEIQASYEVSPSLLRGEPNPQTGKAESFNGDRVGNVEEAKTFGNYGERNIFELAADKLINFTGVMPGDEAVIVATYKFKENSTADRPHVKHGGEFTVTTDFTPVAK